MTITAKMVKELRDQTGAGMMDCKKALVEAGGDLEAAITELRKRGQAKAAKRAGKIAAEGVVAVRVSDDQKTAFIMELNSETDFVSRDEHFKAFANMVADLGLAAKVGNAEDLLALDNGGKSIEELRQELVAKIGENIQVRRAKTIESDALVGAYQHGEKIAVLVELDTQDAELAKDIAMHVAATHPHAIDASAVPAALIEKEREIFTAQAKESGKPDNIIGKMIEGRIAKFLKEVCLLDQPFVKNPDQSISQLLEAKSAKVRQFTRFQVGEGIEKAETDFAEEVRAQVEGR